MSTELSQSVQFASETLSLHSIVRSAETEKDPSFQFTTDWFSQNIPTWLTIFKNYGLLEKPNRCLELGSWEGRSSVFIANYLIQPNDANSELICVDTFKGSMEHDSNSTVNIFERFCHNITLTQKSDQVRVIRGSTLVELPKMQQTFSDYFNFIYVDASHTSTDVLIDALNAFKLLKPGGIMIFDDYEWNAYPNRYLNPKLGIDMFVNYMSPKIYVIHKGYQLAIQKTASL